MSDLDTIGRREIFVGSAGLLAAALPSAVVRSALAEDTAKLGAAAFYKRQPLRLLVGAPAGGGYDALARIVAPHLGRRLGTSVEVEIASDGAAGAMQALLEAPADGTTMMLISAEAAIVRQLLAARGARIDVAGLNWVAGLGASPKVWFAGRASGLKTARDALAARQIRWPAASKADTISDSIAILSYALGLKSKILPGFTRGTDLQRSVIGGKADCLLFPADAAQSLLARGDLMPLAVLGPNRWPSLAKVPTIAEAVPTAPARKWMLDLRLAIGEVQQALAMAPGVPGYRLGYVRKAVGDVLANPVVLDDARAAKLAIVARDGAKLQSHVGSVLKMAGPRLVDIRKVALDSYF